MEILEASHPTADICLVWIVDASDSCRCIHRCIHFMLRISNDSQACQSVYINWHDTSQSLICAYHHLRTTLYIIAPSTTPSVATRRVWVVFVVLVQRRVLVGPASAGAVFVAPAAAVSSLPEKPQQYQINWISCLDCLVNEQ